MEAVSYTNTRTEDRVTKEVLPSPPALPESEFLVLPVFLLSLKCFAALIRVLASVTAQATFCSFARGLFSVF